MDTWPLDRLERKIDEHKQLSVGISRALRHNRSDGRDDQTTLTRVLACHLIAAAKKSTPDEVAAEVYRRHAEVGSALDDMPKFLRRAVVSPAATDVPGWAAELVPVRNGAFDLVVPNSAYVRLASRSMRVTLTSADMRLPARNAAGDIAAAFVAERQPIPVKSAGLTSASLKPKKLGVISFFSNELADYSTPSIETVVRAVIAEDAGTQQVSCAPT